MKHAAQNQDCPLIAGTPACLFVTWTNGDHPSYPTPYPPGYSGDDTPCQHCEWWDEVSSEVDDD